MSSTDTTIRNLQREIGEQERAIDAARADRAAAQADLNRYSARIEEVRAVKSSLSGALNDQAGDVLAVQRDLCDLLAEATTGLSHMNNLIVTVQVDGEHRTEEDDLCSEAHAALQSEIDRCQSEIDAANERISSANAREASAQATRTSCVNCARSLADEDDATVSVNVRTRY